MNEIKDKIQELSSLIVNLPKGYISKKNISGKTQYYLQWTENGKKKSKYIPDSDYSLMEEQIKKRRELEEELKILKQQLPIEKKETSQYIFNTNIKTGESLIKFITNVRNYKKRDCYIELENYLYDKNPHMNNNGKVFVLYGLRRTGKTTLMCQSILNMTKENQEKTAYIQITSKDTLAKLNFDLKELEKEDYHYIFIDEVTLLDDFIEGSALFSDVYASSSMKIILSGTDSLGFIFSEDEQLYNRCLMLHTTFIPYREFERVLGIKGIDEYIRYGGTMCLSGENYNNPFPFESADATSEYIDSAIARNIQHSLKNYQYGCHFRSLIDLYNQDELTSAINRVVEDMNHRFTIDVLTRDFLSSDLSLSQKNLRSDKINGNDVLDRIDETQFNKRLKEWLSIKNKDEQNVVIKKTHELEIKEYLTILDLIMDIPVDKIPVSDFKHYRTVFTQPGLRYCIAESVVKGLLMDKEFESINAIDRNYILGRILNEIKGRMLEDIVLLETKKANPKRTVFKLQFSVGEFDMVVVDEKNITCDIYEIKHSQVIHENQYKNLIDEEKCSKTEFRYGKINNKFVIYRGESKTLDNHIKYINVEDYLNHLGQVNEQLKND